MYKKKKKKKKKKKHWKKLSTQKNLYLLINNICHLFFGFSLCASVNSPIYDYKKCNRGILINLS